MRPTTWTAALALAVAGCASDAPEPIQQQPAGDMGRQGTPVDALPVDMTPVDAALPDKGAPDAAPDQAVPDLGIEPDQAVPDMAIEPDLAPPCDPAPELCNGVDDDCDGETDEGFGVGAACQLGVGACRVYSLVQCAPDGTATCPVTPLAPQAERCDGDDDDCDGRVDEDFDGDGDGYPLCPADVCADCPTPDLPDQCRALCDAQDCRDENVGVFPAAEDVCGDGIDQNCDGQDAPCTEATGRVTVLLIADGGDEGCPDVNRDGAPDNALGLLGALANDPLADSVSGGSLNLFLAASGLAAPGTDGAFALSVLTAGSAGGVYTVAPDALDAEGRARIRFAVARARDGALLAGPGRFALDLPLGDIALRLTLYEARIEGRIGVDEALGLSLDEGLLWGAIRDVDLQAALDQLAADCEAAESPAAFCGPLAMLRPALGNLLRMDQDLDRDGEVDGYGACLRLTVAPTPLAAWPPQ